MEVPTQALPLDEPSTPPKSTAVQMFKEISYGSVAGMISKVFEHPFDLTKVRLQSQVLDSSARFSGPIDCLRKTWLNEGIRGLYRGLPAPVFGAMAENASLFFTYDLFKSLIRSSTHQSPNAPLPLGYHALAAAGAGAVTSFILTPIELVKCKMQVQMLVVPQGTKLPGPLSVFAGVVRSTGVRGLWLGHTGTFIRETGGTAAWFGTKEFVADLLIQRRTQGKWRSNDVGGGREGDRPHLLPWESALSGACAGAMFNLALFPADSVKSAMQTEEELRGKVAGRPKATFMGTFKAMWKAQGLRGLYAGCGVTVARSIPSSAIIFLTYDELKKVFG